MDVLIRVFGPEPGCAKCKGAEKVATEVAQKFQGVTVKKCDVFSNEAEKYSIMMTPTVMVNDVTVEVGRIPSAEKLESAVKKVLEGHGE
jgi:thiol-disulfide isomerase/thioredoxin